MEACTVCGRAAKGKCEMCGTLYCGKKCQARDWVGSHAQACARYQAISYSTVADEERTNHGTLFTSDLSVEKQNELNELLQKSNFFGLPAKLYPDDDNNVAPIVHTIAVSTYCKSHTVEGPRGFNRDYPYWRDLVEFVSEKLFL